MKRRVFMAIVSVLTGLSLRMSADSPSENRNEATGIESLESNWSVLSTAYPDICETVRSIVTNRSESADAIKESLERTFLERPEKTVVYVRDADREAEENRKAREAGRIEMFGAFKKKLEYPEEVVRENREKNHLARLCILKWIFCEFETLEENQQQALLGVLLSVYLYENSPRNMLGTKDSMPVLRKVSEYAASEKLSQNIQQYISQLLSSIEALEQDIALRRKQ